MKPELKQLKNNFQILCIAAEKVKITKSYKEKSVLDLWR